MAYLALIAIYSLGEEITVFRYKSLQKSRGRAVHNYTIDNGLRPKCFRSDPVLVSPQITRFESRRGLSLHGGERSLFNKFNLFAVFASCRTPLQSVFQ